MSVPNAPVRPTPTNLNPRDTVCLQIEVPNDRQWIAAFYDAVEQLSYWYAWDRDDAHTGRDIAERWWQVFLSIRKCREAAPVDGCCDGSEEALLRQNPDNPCLLESSTDGVHWCTLFDQSLCTPANGQPGSGARQPADGGGQECYHADFPSTMQWNLPTVVNAGDVIEIKNTDGQATDAPNHVWYCPSGQLFFAGKCISIPFTQGGDPAASANHMTPVCQIAGVWYPTDTPLTVPVGVTNAPVVFQVNDGVLSDNSGGYSFDVCVTNNQAGVWTKLLSFATTPCGFVTYDAGGGSHNGVYVPGSYWDTTDRVAGGSNQRLLGIEILFPAPVELTACIVTYDYTLGDVSFAPSHFGLEIGDQAIDYISHIYSAVPAGTNKVASWTGDQSGVTLFSVFLECDNAGSNARSGLAHVKSVLLTGKGIEPAWDC